MLLWIFNIYAVAAGKQVKKAILVDVCNSDTAISSGHGKITGRSKVTRFTPINDQSILLVGNSGNESLLGKDQIDVTIIIQIGIAIAKDMMPGLLLGLIIIIMGESGF